MLRLSAAVDTPSQVSYLGAYGVALVSLLSGAAVVHNIFKPDLVRLPAHHRLLVLHSHWRQRTDLMHEGMLCRQSPLAITAAHRMTPRRRRRRGL
jgi:hypothetical protein